MDAPASSTRNVYLNRRMAALLGLGFASGLPAAYKLLGSTLQAWQLSVGFDVKAIGLMSLVTLPLALNFLWAPLLDRYAPDLRLNMGRRRSWMLIFQAALMVAIALLGLLGPTTTDDSIVPLVIMAATIAFFVASHDVVADAYRTDVLSDRELGAGAAVFVNGYRIAMVIAGGGALLLANVMPWSRVYVVLAALMGIGILATWFAPEPPDHGGRPTSLKEAFVAPVFDFFGRKRLAAGATVLGFAICFKLPDSMANAMINPLLLDGLAYSQTQVALLREWLGLGAVIVGALIGGGVMARLGVIGSLWLFGMLQALSNLGFCLLAAVGVPSVPLLAVVVTFESFCGGLVTAGFIGFLMAQCNRRYSATQYAMFTSVMYGAGAVLASCTGYLVAALGYQSFFLLTIAAAAPGMLLLAVMTPSLRPAGSGVGARTSEEPV